MNNRNIIIVAALAVPVIGLALLSHSGTPERQPAPPRVAARAPNNQFKMPSVAEVRARVALRMKEFDAMTPAQYAEYRKTRPSMPASLDQVRAAMHNRYNQLEKMTEEQWQADTRRRLAALKQQPKPAASTPAPQKRQVPSQQPAAR